MAALLGAEPSARETRLLGESQIIDGPNVKDEPSPPEPKPPVQTVTVPPIVKKSPQVMPPPKQATLTTTVSPKSVSPKSVSPKSTSAKSALPMMVPPEKEVKPKVKGKEKSPPKDKGQGNVLAEVTQKEVKPKVKGKEKSPPKDKGQGNVLAEVTSYKLGLMLFVMFKSLECYVDALFYCSSCMSIHKQTNHHFKK